VSLFDNPVRAHYNDQLDEVPVLWCGMTSDDKAIICQHDGKIEFVGVEWITADWRWFIDHWEDLQAPVAPDRDDET
jgi:hypothetical protein